MRVEIARRIEPVARQQQGEALRRLGPGRPKMQGGGQAARGFVDLADALLGAGQIEQDDRIARIGVPRLAESLGRQIEAPGEKRIPPLSQKFSR